MTLQPQSDFSIPEETVRVARAAYPKGNLYMQMRDAKGPTSSSWTPAIDHRKNEVIKIKFSTTDSRSCPRLTSCTSSRSPTPCRLITVRPHQQHERCKPLVVENRQEHSPSSMHNEKGSKPRFRKACAPLICVVRAILAKKKRICNILVLPRRSMWCVP